MPEGAIREVCDKLHNIKYYITIYIWLSALNFYHDFWPHLRNEVNITGSDPKRQMKCLKKRKNITMSDHRCTIIKNKVIERPGLVVTLLFQWI